MRAEGTDRDLVEAVRAGDDAAFDELYRRYRPRITAYVGRMVRDPGRAEDLAQDALFSALRRIRATDAEIAFKPWIFEIARNAAIDHWRRTSRAEEISVEEDGRLRQSDRLRLTGAAGPHSTVAGKERLEHLRGALDELSDVHSRIIVLRELEGLSYREIAERLDLTESSVQSALFRARKRLESEYSEISQGRRCVAMRTVMGRMAEGLGDKREAGRLARHARRCHICRRRARELGVELVPPLTRLRRRAAALLPFPLLPRRGGSASGAAAGGSQGAGAASGLLPAGAQVGAVVAERAVAIVAAAAIAGAGGVALGGADVLGGDREPQRPPAPEPGAPGSGLAGAAGSHDRGARPSRAPDATTSPPPRGRHRQAAPAGGNAAGPDGGGPGADGAGGLPDANAPNGLPEAKGPGELPDPKAPAVDRRPPGDVGIPSLPDRPPDAPRLPDAPSPPSVEAPQAPELPLESPGVEAAPPAPIDPPAAPNLPPVDAGVQPDAVTAIGGG